MALSREALLGATELPTEDVPIPELGGSVTVRGMSAKERTLYEKKFITESRGRTKRNFDAFREQLVVFCCVDPKFTESDVDRLSVVRCDVIERIANVAMKLSGITEKDVEELGAAFAGEDSLLYFVFGLARELGKTVGELLTGMSSMELTMWQAYFIEDARRSEDARQRAEADRRILGDDL